MHFTHFHLYGHHQAQSCGPERSQSSGANQCRHFLLGTRNRCAPQSHSPTSHLFLKVLSKFNIIISLNKNTLRLKSNTLIIRLLLLINDFYIISKEESTSPDCVHLPIDDLCGVDDTGPCETVLTGTAVVISVSKENEGLSYLTV